MQSDFLAIGECMVEMAPSGADKTYALGFAGDTFNTAWYMRHIASDLHVSYLTCVGQDSVSDQFMAFLTDAGIDSSHIRRDPLRTLGLYLISLENGERSFSYWRGQSAAKRLADDQGALTAAMEDSRMIYLSGITLAILDADARATLLAALAAARSNGATIAFDPNLRPRLWPDTASMCAAVSEAAKVSDIVLPSYDDEAEYFGDASPQDTLNRYRTAGARVIVVKNGGGDILYSDGTEDGTFAVEPLQDVVDSTAAGDSFNAGFFHALVAGQTMEESVIAGSNLARKVIAGRGALVAI